MTEPSTVAAMAIGSIITLAIAVREYAISKATALSIVRQRRRDATIARKRRHTGIDEPPCPSPELEPPNFLVRRWQERYDRQHPKSTEPKLLGWK